MRSRVRVQELFEDLYQSYQSSDPGVSPRNDKFITCCFIVVVH